MFVPRALPTRGPGRLQLVVAAAVTAAFEAALILVGYGTADHALSDLGILAASVFATAALVVRARRATHPAPFWFLAAYAATWSAGQLSWSVLQLALGDAVPLPSVADVFYFAALPLAVVAVASIARRAPSGAVRLLALLDALVVTGALFVLAWELVLERSYAEATGTVLERMASVAYPVAYTVVGAVVLAVLARTGLPRMGSLLGWVLASFTVICAANLVYAYLLLRGTYRSGHPLDVLWFLSFLLLAGGARWGREEGAPPEVSGRAALPGLPFVPTVVSAALLAAGYLDGVSRVAGFAIVAIAAARQYATVRENQRLNEALGRRVEAGDRELVVTNRRFASIVKNASDVFALTDEDGRITYISPAVRRLLGYPPEDLLGRRGRELFRPEDAVTVETARDALASGATDEVLFEVVAVHADGSTRDLEILLTSALDDPHLRCMIASVRDVSARHRARDELAAMDRRFRAVVHQSSDLIVISDGATVTYVSPAVTATLGYAPAEVEGRSGLDLIHPDDRRHSARQRLALLRGREVLPFEERVRHRDGSYRTVEMAIASLPDEHGGTAIVSIGRDITDRKLAAQALRAAEERFRSGFEHSPVGIGLVDAETGGFLRANPALCSLLGRSQDELDGRPLLTVIHRDDVPEHLARLARLRDGTVDSYEAEQRYLHSSGRVVWGQATVTLVRADDDTPGYLFVQVSDVTARRRAEEALAFRAEHDESTGLLNRLGLGRRLAEQLEAGRPMSVLLVGLDHFRIINESLGHDAADRLLVSVAQSLAALARPGELIARVGGDEFVLCHAGGGDGGRGSALLRSVFAVFDQPVQVNGQDVWLSSSVGVCHAQPGTEAATVLRNADAALHRAKENGRGGHRVFDEDLVTRAQARLQMGGALRRAIERQEFRLVYQPEVRLDGSGPYAVEALLRWDDGERGPVWPEEFIPVAEDTNLIVPIGAWVLQQACRDAAFWSSWGGDDLALAVNLSARQIADPYLVERVAAALAESGLRPGRLCLEITETALMDDASYALSVLRRLKGLGVRLAIDDFGTGYSSLSYLRRFPVDYVKVDRSFVSGLGSDQEDSAIVRAVADVGHALGLEVVGEGVETVAQRAELERLGCEHGQGFLWSRPVEVVDLRDVVRRLTPLPADPDLARGDELGVPAGAGASPRVRQSAPDLQLP